MRRTRLWPALVGLLAALTILSAGSAGLSKADPPMPAWVLASVVAGLGILASAVISPLVAAHLKVISDRLTRSEERRLRQLAAVEPSTAGAELPLVRELTSRRVLGIHAAIPLPAEHHSVLSAELPMYVPRDRDADVHAALSRMSTMGGFLVLVGLPASGKTRCMATAVQHLFGDWRMLIPDGAAGLTALVNSGATLARTVVWLDDIHELMESGSASASVGSGSRINAALVRRLFLPGAGPVIVVGTTWPEKRALFLGEPGDQLEDLYADARRVMDMADVIDLDAAFTDAEWSRAEQLADSDPRIAEAMAMDGGRSLAATLANAPDLIRRWRSTADYYVRAVLTAAVDARRCGHPAVIPASLLQRLADTCLSGDQRANAPPTWFVDAAGRACRWVRGTAPLAAHAAETGVLDGYTVSDILLAHAAADSSVPLVSEQTWALVCINADGPACGSVAAAAYSAGRMDAASIAASRGALVGDRFSLFAWAYLSADQGDTEKAERLYREAFAAGDARAANNLAVLLVERKDFIGAELLYRQAIAAGDTRALENLDRLIRTAEGEPGAFRSYHPTSAGPLGAATSTPDQPSGRAEPRPKPSSRRGPH